MSNKVGSEYVVYEDLMNRGYVNLDFKKAVSDGISAALWGGGLAFKSHKSGCFRISLIISGFSMNANIRIRPWHLGHVKGLNRTWADQRQTDGCIRKLHITGMSKCAYRMFSGAVTPKT